MMKNRRRDPQEQTKDFGIEPHIGIGPVKLGMSREEVKDALGAANYTGSNEGIDFYFDNSFQIEFEDDRADFVGVSYCPGHTVRYEGVNVFDTEARALFAIISSNEGEDNEFDSLECIFPRQIVTLWAADEQYDHMGTESRLIWAQVGVGTPSYLRAVR